LEVALKEPHVGMLPSWRRQRGRQRWGRELRVEVEEILGGALHLHLYHFFLISNHSLFLLFLDVCSTITEVFACCGLGQNVGYNIIEIFPEGTYISALLPYS
jgi:hypothetical protein